MSYVKNALKTLFHGDAEYIDACLSIRDSCEPSLRTYVLHGAIARLTALKEGSIDGSPKSIVDALVREANCIDISRELETVSRREKKGHADPDLECPRCRSVGTCISKQVHDRLGTDEGATRYVSCSACGVVTRMR